MVALSACEKLDESHKESIEDSLIRSFKAEDPALKKHVSDIVRQAEEDQYQEALNKLALLSATHTLNKEQKKAIDALVRQLRYDMEEEIFADKERKE